MDRRDLYLTEALRSLPHLIELLDRNRVSRTYGSFDRSFWHYRTSDFPSGMYQECVLPLALAYHLDHPANPFYQQENLHEWVRAGIDFARRSSHRDGSCDDYFPYERAVGAAAFSLYAMTETSLLFQFSDPSFLDFFKRRGRYLAKEGCAESGILSNHRALIVLCLYNVYLATGEEFFKREAESKLGLLLFLQTREGWFPEYEGCDPGYLSFTIDFLAKYYRKSGNERVAGPLARAIDFSSNFVHPDGTYGGEYGSRNTFHLLPHGLELMAPQVPVAGWMAEQFLSAIEKGRSVRLDDDRIVCHYVYNYLQAHQDYSRGKDTAPSKHSDTFFHHFKEAGLVVKRGKERYGVISTQKGGASKIYKGNELVWADAGLAGCTVRGRKFTSAVMHTSSSRMEGNHVVVEGDCHEHQDMVFSTWLFVLFRLFILLLGRFLPANFIRSLLQRKAILKSGRSFPLHYVKKFDLERLDSVEIELKLTHPGVKIKELWIASDATFMYVATSQPFQPGVLKQWIDLSSLLDELNTKRTAVFRREFQ